MQIKKLVLATGLALATLAAQASPVTVKIIGFNDFHGNLLSPGKINGNAVGGADYFAGYVTDLKSKNPLNIVVGAGDLIGASPLVSALFNDEGTIEVLNRVGLEVSSVGNHEFDKGQFELLRMQKGGCKVANGAQDPNSCKGATVGTPVPFEGAKFKYLSANVVVDATGKTLLPPYAVKSFKNPATGKTVRVGFIGMTLKDTPTIVTPAGVAGLTFKDEAATVNGLVPQLRALGVEAIVVLVHQGANGAPALPNVNGCLAANDPNLDPIKSIVAQLDDHVSMVVSGHSHLAYNCQMPNKAGRSIPVTQASSYGKVLTDIDMTLDDVSGGVTGISATNRIVDRTSTAITPNAAVNSIVTKYNNLVAPLANVVIGSITTDLPNTGDEMPAGDLIADAQLAATQAPAPGNAQIALMNRGGVRASFSYNAPAGVTKNAGEMTYGEAFTVQPFGNILQTLTLTPQQLKDVLEQQWNGCQIAGEPLQTTDRIMQISNGFKYTWNSTVSAATCSRVQHIELNGTVIYDTLSSPAFQVPAGTTYQVTVNNFMASGGDGFTVLKHGLNPIGGGQDIDSLVAYMAGFKSPAYNPSSSSLNKPRITKL